jgi:hypothetical protein
MSIAAPPSSHELLRRERKCHILANWLHEEFIRIIQDLEDERWENAAAKAGVNKPSEQSKARVLEIIKEKLIGK